jgi:hypothetical protein
VLVVGRVGIVGDDFSRHDGSDRLWMLCCFG